MKYWKLIYLYLKEVFLLISTIVEKEILNKQWNSGYKKGNKIIKKETFKEELKKGNKTTQDKIYINK